MYNWDEWKVLAKVIIDSDYRDPETIIGMQKCRERLRVRRHNNIGLGGLPKTIPYSRRLIVMMIQIYSGNGIASCLGRVSS
jgi:hypothetical protein